MREKTQKRPFLAVGVVAHPDRDEMATNLGRSVRAEVVSFDTGGLGSTTTEACAANHIAVLNWLVAAAEWIVMLEDDAVPVHDFRVHVAAALSHAPTPVVGLYLGTGNPVSPTQQTIRSAVERAKDADHAWIVGDCLIGSVGYAVRQRHVSDMLDFIEERDEELPLRISRWAQSADVAICYTQPSLVDHDDGESIGRPYRSDWPKRKAWYHGTRINWATEATMLGSCPTWSKEQT